MSTDLFLSESTNSTANSSEMDIFNAAVGSENLNVNSSENTNGTTDSSEVDILNLAVGSEYLNIKSESFSSDSTHCSNEIENEQSAQTMEYDIPTNTPSENLEFLEKNNENNRRRYTSEDFE